MEILVLGGTQFVGKHLVDAALDRGHVPTLFHRGKTGTELFPDVERVLGDRDGGLGALAGRTFDAVIDTSGYVPRLVGDAARALRAAADRALFISTVSVYADRAAVGQDEDAPLETLDDPTTETIDGKTYGGLKVLCEEVFSEVWGSAALIVRPGYIVGPDDHTDRFTAWVRRVAAGGEFLAPGSADDPMQWIDVRDLAHFSIDALERELGGVFTVTGPRTSLTWGRFFTEASAALEVDATPVWAPEEFVVEHALTGTEIPLWHRAAMAGLHTMALDRAFGAGLTLAPLADTVRDTLGWDRAHGVLAGRDRTGLPPQCGLDPDREEALLAQLRD